MTKYAFCGWFKRTQYCCHRLSRKNGKNRVNLFHQSRVDTIEMAKDVIQFRNKNLSPIFKLFVVHMCSRDLVDFKLDPTKDKVLEESLRSDYVNMCCLFRKSVGVYFNIHFIYYNRKT